MDLTKCVLYLYPDAKPGDDFYFEAERKPNGAEEIKIAKWTAAGNKPTIRQLQDVWPQAQAQANNINENERKIEEEGAKILRSMAVSSLKAKGEIPSDYV